MVVVVIIGIVTAGALLTLGAVGRDRELDSESERLQALMNYAREQAELQTREYGLQFEPDRYRFVVFDHRKQMWVDEELDDSLRERDLPEGLQVRLVIEGRPIVVRRPPPDSRDRTPQLMIFSNGDLTPFELSLQREGGAPSVTLSADQQGRIEVKAPPERST
jgi:general secretion pathway protein H